MNSYNNITTKIDLYNFLQTYENNNIIEWLQQPWVGKDKQESLLRLFSELNLISKIDSYNICKGIYNTMTISKQKNVKEIFYDENNNLINLKDTGDSSDLTGIHKENNKHLLVTTSKNLNKIQVGKLDIDKILTHFRQYEEKSFTMTLCICIKNVNEFNIMKNNIKKSNTVLKKILEKKDTIIIDWNDLNIAYINFKNIYKNKSLDSIIDLDLTFLKHASNRLMLRMHQHFSATKTIKLKNYGEKNVLFGHIPRSGKSYIIGGCIILDSKNKNKCNYLIITTAPNETIQQQQSIFNYIQFKKFNIVVLNGNNKTPILTNKNIILCSKQFLQSKLNENENGNGNENENENENGNEKTKSIDWLHNMIFDMRFIDESHNGGTTKLAKRTLDFYGKDAFSVYVTATYFKPVNDYNICKKCQILWDLEDIKLCKNIDTENNINKLIKKHGTDIKKSIELIVEKYGIDHIKNCYSEYPQLWILTQQIVPNIIKEINTNTQNNYYGWSSIGTFLLKQSIKKDTETNELIKIFKEEFQNEEKVLELFYYIFGELNKFGIPNNKYPDSIVFMKRIEKICKNILINSRYPGEGFFNNEPMIIMAFLPQDNINMISNALIKLLINKNVIPDYEIISINSTITKDPKQDIEKAHIKAKNNGKKGVLVLSGRQCSLGVSIKNCDIVLLLNNNKSNDMIYQMMFRCMTEGKGKTCGFVIDLNIHRVINNSIINYSSILKPDEHPKKAVKYLLQEKLITLNGDHWMPCFGNGELKLEYLCNDIYEIYSSNIENAINHLLNRLKFKELLLEKNEQELFNAIFSNVELTKEQVKVIDTLINDDEKKEIQPGIEKIKIENDNMNDNTNNKDVEKDNKRKNVNYMDILRHVIPLVCLLSIHDKQTSFIEMIKFIEKHKNIYNILIDQTRTWWGKLIDSKIIKTFINIYIKYKKNDTETNQIIRTVKEIFIKNINNSKELSILIDKYLIPQELEKKTNAEVSTPYALRQEMLDTIPEEFWKKPHKVFEPCAGKGGFVIDIIDRFMKGLKDSIPDKKQRYKTIIEKCLYFADINPTNIFICKLLIDPYNEYDLNYNEGNTLTLNIKEKWGIEGFDAVIGNPPYTKSKEKINGQGGSNLWIEFCKKSLNVWLILDGYLLFIHPPMWRKPYINVSRNSIFYKQMLSKQIISLRTYNEKDIGTLMNASTRADYYLIKNCKKTNNIITFIDLYNNYFTIDISNFGYIPNAHLNIFNKIFSKKEEPIKAYKTTKCVKVDKEYLFINNLTKTKFIESKLKKKHELHGVPKILFSDTRCPIFIFDKEGKYGLSSNILYIKTTNNNMLKYLNTKLIKFIIKNSKYSTFRTDWEIFHYIPDIKIYNNEDFTISKLYEYFNFTKEEITIIENS